MINFLEGTVRHYLWGSHNFIPEMLGISPDGRPWAELWLGAHPSDPSQVLLDGTDNSALLDGADNTVHGTDNTVLLDDTALSNNTTSSTVDLKSLIASNTARYLGSKVSSRFGQLPFMMKILAVSQPLSLQAHPSTAQAWEGYSREQSLGIPLDAPHRSFRDPHHKPELVCALTEFEALCGIRNVEDTLTLVNAIDTDALDSVRYKLQQDPSPQGIHNLIEWLLLLDTQKAAELVNAVTQACSVYTKALVQPRPAETETEKRTTGLNAHNAHTGFDLQIAKMQSILACLGDLYPGDTGVVVAMLLNHVSLAPGESLFLPAGKLHSYLHGAAVEVMACSDNVLRCGLTHKHVDVENLLNIVNTTPEHVQVEHPELLDNIAVYHTPAPEFILKRVQVTPHQTVTVDNDGPSVLLCTQGQADITSHTGMNSITVTQGQSIWVDAAEPAIELTGNATIFCAHPNI